MPTALSKNRVEDLKRYALNQMNAGRDDLLKQVSRSIERGWDYGEGKKTAAKVAVGATVGAGVAAIGVVTHGAGIPVIAGLAVGGFVVGNMSDTAFAKLWGRNYTGGAASREWMGNNPKIDSGGQAKLMEERAHKTVRRAFQHYRTACEKMKAVKKLCIVAPQSCDQASEAVTALLEVKRHLDKARMYVYPSIFLSGHVLEYYEKTWTKWSGKDDDDVRGAWHPDKNCGCSRCYFTQNPNLVAHVPAPWDQGNFNLAKMKSEIATAKKQMEIDPTLGAPIPNNIGKGTRDLFLDAQYAYTYHRGMGVKMAHSFTNQWARKTNREKVIVGAKQVVSAALAGGSAGAHVHADELLNALAVFIDGAFTSFGLVFGEGSEDVTLGSAPANGHIESQAYGSAMGEESQEQLRKSATHLWEAGKVIGRIWSENSNSDDFKGTTCDQAVEYERQVYKIRHHLVETRCYLEETIELVTELASRVDRDLFNLTYISNRYIRAIDAFMKGHQSCEKGDCYKAA
jgi:hypothetical protein